MWLRTQKLMIELADALDRLLQLLIIVEPSANFSDPLATYAELLRAPAGVGHRENEHLVPLTTCALRTISGVSNRALEQRAAEQLASDWQLGDKLVAGS
jgi:hypothetical protein